MGRWLSGRWMVTPPIPSDEEFAWASKSIRSQNLFPSPELLLLLPSVKSPQISRRSSGACEPNPVRYLE